MLARTINHPDPTLKPSYDKTDGQAGVNLRNEASNNVLNFLGEVSEVV